MRPVSPFPWSCRNWIERNPARPCVALDACTPAYALPASVLQQLPRPLQLRYLHQTLTPTTESSTQPRSKPAQTWVSAHASLICDQASQPKLPAPVSGLCSQASLSSWMSLWMDGCHPSCCRGSPPTCSPWCCFQQNPDSLLGALQ